MEFWGVEVKAGETLKVSLEEGKVIHLSQAALGDSKKGKGENAHVFVKVNEQKLVMGTLSSDKFPQISYDVVFDSDFELSHNWKNGSVFFCGYKTQNPVEYEGSSDDEFDSDSEMALENGKSIADMAKPSPSVKIEDAKADSDDDSSDEDDSDDDSDDDEMDSDDSDDEDDSSEEEKEEEKAPTPKKDDKKRPIEAQNKTPDFAKKAKLATPQKTDGKKSAAAAHTATPHHAKQVGKTSKHGNSKTPASTGKPHSNAKRAAK